MKKLVKIVSLKGANSIAQQMYIKGYKEGTVNASRAFTKGSIIGLGIVVAGSLVATKIKASKEANNVQRQNQPEDVVEETTEPSVEEVTEEVTDEK